MLQLAHRDVGRIEIAIRPGAHLVPVVFGDIAQFGQWFDDKTVAERQLVLATITLTLTSSRVDSALVTLDADAVQAAGEAVGAAVFLVGTCRRRAVGEHHFHRRHAHFRVDADRNAAPSSATDTEPSPWMRTSMRLAKAGQRFVGGVVDHLPMMCSGFSVRVYIPGGA